MQSAKETDDLSNKPLNRGFKKIDPEKLKAYIKDNAVFQIKSLKINISPDYRLQFYVRKFTSELLNRNLLFLKRTNIMIVLIFLKVQIRIQKLSKVLSVTKKAI